MIKQFINAAKEGLTEDIEKMLKEQPDLLQAMSDDGETPLMGAVYHGKHNVIQQLLSYGVAISLYEAAAIGELEVVQYLVEEGNVSLSEYSYDGWTPLHLASFFGTYEIAEFLIEQGADVNAMSSNNQYNMPIHAATAGRKYALVKLLLDHEADPNLKQSGGWTPLLQAVNNFDIEMSKLLLDYGADPLVGNDQGHTPLKLAEEKEYEEIIALLNSQQYKK